MSSDDFKPLADSLMSKKDASFFKYLSIDPDDPDIDLSSEYIEDDSEANLKKNQNLSYENAASSVGCNFINNWREWERTFRLNLARQRALKTERDLNTIAESPVVYLDAIDAAIRAFDETSPLEAELIIDKARWNAIDEFAGSDYFDRINVYAYYLKLLILERRQKFNVENGFSEYKNLYNEIVKNYQNSEFNYLGAPK
jgi:hypothetical protein